MKAIVRGDRAGAAVGAALAVTLGWLAACVGDDPSLAVDTPDSSTDAAPDGGSTTPMDDAAADTGTHDDAPFCKDAGPTVFTEGPGMGPYCRKAGAGGGNHCAFGEHCCITPGAADTCASACPGTSADVACFNAEECSQDGGARVCCAIGTLDTTTCSYPTINGFRGSECSAACAGPIVLCQAKAECGALACVGATTNLALTTVAVCH